EVPASRTDAAQGPCVTHKDRLPAARSRPSAEPGPTASDVQTRQSSFAGEVAGVCARAAVGAAIAAIAVVSTTRRRPRLGVFLRRGNVGNAPAALRWVSPEPPQTQRGAHTGVLPMGANRAKRVDSEADESEVGVELGIRREDRLAGKGRGTETEGA